MNSVLSQAGAMPSTRPPASVTLDLTDAGADLVTRTAHLRRHGARQSGAAQGLCVLQWCLSPIHVGSLIR